MNLLSIETGQFFPTQYMANDDLSEPPRRADSNNSIFIFCRILGPHLRGPQVSLGRILGGGASIEPFFGGGSSQSAVPTPAPSS